jgi:hypothetical protein
MIQLSSPRSAYRSRTDLCDDWSTEAVTAAHVTVRDIGRPFRGESFMFPLKNGRFSQVCGKIACLIADETVQ